VLSLDDFLQCHRWILSQVLIQGMLQRCLRQLRQVLTRMSSNVPLSLFAYMRPRRYLIVPVACPMNRTICTSIVEKYMNSKQHPEKLPDYIDVHKD
jgi:hypothetical protein